MNLSRRSFFAGLAAVVAAPAIVKVESLMKLAPTEVLQPTLRQITEYLPLSQEVTRLDVLYGRMTVRPEWEILGDKSKLLTLDDYSERILAPMVNRLADQVADSIMRGDSATFTQWNKELTEVSVKTVKLQDLLIEARSTISDG